MPARTFLQFIRGATRHAWTHRLQSLTQKAAAAAILAAAFGAGVVQAADFVATDETSLNAAIMAANAAGAGSTYVIEINSASPINLTGDLTHLNPTNPGVTVQIVTTNSQQTTIAAAGHQVFSVDSGAADIANLTISNARAAGGDGGLGGSVNGGGGGGGLGAGGGLFVSTGANVTIRNVGFTTTQAIGGDGRAISPSVSGGGSGGGLNGGGTLGGNGNNGAGGSGGTGGSGPSFPGSGGAGGAVGNPPTAGSAGTDGGGGGGGGSSSAVGGSGAAGGTGGYGAGGGGGGSGNNGGAGGGAGAAGYGAGAGGGGSASDGESGSGRGGGAFVMHGGSLTVINTADYNYNGNTVAPGTSGVGAGADSLGNDFFVEAAFGPAGTLTFQVDSGVLTYEGSFSSNAVGSIAGEGGINKTGLGTMILENIHIYTGDTNVLEGALYLNGTMTSNVNVSAGATFGGIGSTTLDINNSGTVDPGALSGAIGTLTAGGAYNSGAGSTLQIDSDGTNNDLLAVNAANLNGNGTVFVHKVGDFTPTLNTPYTFLTSTTTITTQFAGVTDDFNYPLVDVMLGYNANDVYFFHARNSTTFESIGNTPNERAVGGFLDRTENIAAGDYRYVIDNLLFLYTDQLRAAYNQMGGESYGTSGQYGLQTTTLILQQVANRMSSLAMFGPRGDAPSINFLNSGTQVSVAAAATNPIQQVSHAETKEADQAIPVAGSVDPCDAAENHKVWNGWSAGYGLSGHAGSDGNAATANFGVGGILAGVDRWMDESTLVGVFGGYMSSSLTTNTPNAYVSDNAGQGGLYAMRRGDILYASGVIGGQADSFTSHRTINFAAIQRQAVGNYDGWQGYGYSELGGNFTGGPCTLQPFGAFQYIHVRQNSFSETGAGSLNLNSGGLDTDSLRSFLGTRLRLDLEEVAFTRRLIPEFMASWMHEYIDASTSLNARFGGIGGTSFITTGLNGGRDWALIGAGAQLVITENLRLTGNYFLQTNDRQTYHVGAGGVNLQW